jgi:hypothetical protein
MKRWSDEATFIISCDEASRPKSSIMNHFLETKRWLYTASLAVAYLALFDQGRRQQYYYRYSTISFRG